MIVSGRALGIGDAGTVPEAGPSVTPIPPTPGLPAGYDLSTGTIATPGTSTGGAVCPSLKQLQGVQDTSDPCQSSVIIANLQAGVEYRDALLAQQAQPAFSLSGNMVLLIVGGVFGLIVITSLMRRR